MLGWEQQDGFLGARMLVDKWSLDIEGGDTSIDIKTMLNTEVYRSWSWLTRLVKILLVKCSEAHYVMT